MRDKENLLEETIEVMASGGKTPQDVCWISAKPDYRHTEGAPMPLCSWEVFAALADFVYDNGFGEQNINPNLLIVGEDWWLERHEYDGSEWWEFKSLPTKPEKTIPIRPSDLYND